MANKRVKIYERVQVSCGRWTDRPITAPKLRADDQLGVLSQEGKIRLIHKCCSNLLDHLCDELRRKSGWSIKQVSDEIVASARNYHFLASQIDAVAKR
jgi:hypothetical protein